MGPSVIGIGGVWFIEAWLGGIETSDLFRPVGVQPLASKCRVEPTGFVGGRSIRGPQRTATGRLN